MEKYEWKKKEKNLYLPKAKPEIIDIPSFKFFTFFLISKTSKKTKKAFLMPQN